MSQRFCKRCNASHSDHLPRNDQPTSLQSRRKHSTELCLCTLEHIPEAKETPPEPVPKEGTKLCCMCMNATANCILQPCGHSRTCHTCGELIMTLCNGHCPTCRQKLTSIQNA